MFSRWSIGLCLLVVLAGCGGGGTSSSLPHGGSPGGAPGPGASTPPGPATQVAFSITIPAGSAQSALRRPRYVSSATQSLAIAVNGGAPTVVNTTAGSPGCTSGSAGLTCTVTVSAPAGSDTFSETLYSATNAGGSVLSKATTTSTIVAGQANTVNLVLNGVIARIVLALANATPPQGAASAIGLTVTAYDAANQIIIGDPFANPIALTDSDAKDAPIVPTTTINQPSDAANLVVNYDGAATGPITFGATSTGVTNVTGATLTPQGSGAVTFNDYPTYGYDNQRDGFNPNTAAFTPASIAQLHRVFTESVNDYNTQTQPIVATNLGGHQALIFIGGASGNAYALDGTTKGAPVWTRQLGQEQLTCSGSGSFYVGVGGTAAYDPSSKSIYIGSSKNTGINAAAQDVIYRLDALSGGILGSVNITPNSPSNEIDFLHTSITLANGMVYAGTSSTCDIPSWKGRIASANASTLALSNAFFPVYNQTANPQPYSGGGVWGWGGVSVDDGGNVYAGTGNADTGSPQQAPFVQAPNEYAAYSESVLKLTSSLGLIDQNHPPLTMSSPQSVDLDLSGTPVLYHPSVGCTFSASQGKSGQLFIYNTASLSAGPIANYQLSQSLGDESYLGNPGYSPKTGLLYADVNSGTGTLYPPGMIALAANGCSAPSVAWHAAFGPDSYAFSTHAPRSAPTATAGGVVFVGTGCSPDGTGTTCTASGSTPNGAVWALDATNGTVLNGGKPVLITGDAIRMAPVVDGQWMWVLDNSGDFYAMTIDSSVAAQASTARQTRNPLSVYHGPRH